MVTRDETRGKIMIRYRLLAVIFLFFCSFNEISSDESPTFSNDLNNLVLPENTAVGTIIGTLNGSDPEGSLLHYGIEGTDLLSVDADSGDVKLVKPFDREINDTLKFIVTAEDDVNKTENKAGNNIIKVESSIIIEDVNDNAPKFTETPYEFSIDEDTPVETTIFKNIKVEDNDLVGEALDVVCLESEYPNDCEKFVIVPISNAPNAYEGAIVLKKPLNYNEKQLYQLPIVATDGQHNATTSCKIRISDVQNLPPSFQSSLTAIVQEDAPIGTLVITLQARDGDRGVPRNIVYNLISNPFDYFLLDANSGELRTAKLLDRENVIDTNGVLSLTVQAREVDSGVPLSDEKSSITAEVSVTIRDVNDEPPKFNKKEYLVRLPENLPKGSPLPYLNMVVNDTDIGNNSAYLLKLDDVSGAFTVEPATAVGTTTVIIRLTNGSLDFENPNQKKFIVLVIAEETSTKSRLSSTATLTIEVTDVNDNAPEFENPTFTAYVNESALSGTFITKITATDRDSGEFGADGIVYELIGEGADKFDVDKKTGVITVALNSIPGAASHLDYETKSLYFLTYKATDEEGKGYSTSVPLQITLTDNNDNSPIFETINYTTVIEEGATKFEPSFFVKAEDADKTSRVTYSIVDEAAKALFDIDPITGEIKILSETGLFGNNESNTITFAVAANDGTFTSECSVNVQVLDVNNNVPEFVLDEYSIEIPEDFAIGKSVTKVRASDKDSGANANLTYRIERGGFEDFSIDGDAGVIKVASKLDYDKRNRYNITVVATDGGTPTLTGSVTVYVHILNANDKNPYLTPFNQRTEVPKNAPIGTKFYRISALDPDTNDTNVLRFEFAEPISAIDKHGKQTIDDDIFKTFFAIDENNGDVFVAKPLSRDIAAVVTLSVVVRDTSAKNVQEGNGTLMITILDVNDIAPSFSPPWSPKSPYYVVHMQEESPVGSVLDTFTATDRDSDIHHYAIEPASEYFAVNETTGVIWTRKRIDYETIQSINFTLVAYDVGEPQLSTTAKIIVNVTNINDNGPVFEKPEYESTVKENSPKDTPVLRVAANDADLGDFGKIRYVFKGDSSDFVIDEQTGAIKVAANAASLDRERTSEILLKVEASDLASKEERRTAIVPVTIKIEDTNDNPPIFSQHLYSANIVETIPYKPASPIVKLHANDADEKGRLQYHIVNGNDEDAFNLDFNNGILYPKRSLLGLLKQFKLTVEVVDGKFTDTAVIEVNVLDVNQNKPFFIEPSSTNASVLIPENVEVNHLVVKVLAEDKDPGDNGRVTYHFKVGNNNTQFTDEFRIDENSGELRTTVPLDRENKSSFQMIIIAKDHGTQTTYETIQFLTVILKDVDDNKPKFVSKGDGSYEYTFTVNENNKKNHLIGKIVAEDPDNEENAKIYYYIIRGNENQMFSLDRRDGSIYALDTLDRERGSSYEFYAKTTNNANYNSAANEIIAKGDPTIARVVIVVKDENDNVPYFVREVYYAGVKFDSIAGEYVADVKAFDLDEGVYGELNYSIQASYLYRSGSNNASGIVKSPFSISSDGRVTTNNLVSSFNQYRFELTVVASEKENSSHKASVALNVWVYQIEQLVRVVVSRPPDMVKSQINNIVDTLRNATGNIVVVDAIKHHTDTKHPVRRYWCDFYIHMVDDTQTILPTDDVLTVIDLKYDHLKNWYNDYYVQNLVPAYTENTDQPPFEFALAALVALTIVLLVGCVSVLILCCCFRHWIVMEPLDMKCDMLIKKPIIDDLSTTENPLWIEQKLKLYEEQELTMQVFCEPEAGRLPAYSSGERRDNDEMSTVDNTYATIQQPGRRNSANTMLSMGPGDYATLGGSVLPLDRTSSHSQQMIEAALGFQGCTFQVPEIPADTTELLRARSELRMNKDGQPEFVSELM